MDQAAHLTIIRTYQQPLPAPERKIIKRTIFQRLNAKDKHAVADFIREHGGEVWDFAKKHTRSTHEAEVLSREIVEDIWTFADRSGSTVTTSEQLIIENIATRRLIKYKWKALMRSK